MLTSYVTLGKFLHLFGLQILTGKAQEFDQIIPKGCQLLLLRTCEHYSSWSTGGAQAADCSVPLQRGFTEPQRWHG
jgi:hypothetical protein